MPKILDEEITVVHNKEEQRFEAEVNGQLAEADYSLRDDRIIFTHTGVPRSIGGQGVASKLIKTALDYARENNLKVVPLCSFVAAYMRRHREYQDLLASDRSF